MAYKRHERVFSAGGRCFTWADVISAAQARGDWAALQCDHRRLLAVERVRATANSLPAADEIRSAAAQFRYRRSLLSGDELTDWLLENDVTFSEWTGEMRRSALVPDDHDAPVDITPDTDDTDEEAVERATWVYAVCSGRLGDYTRRLAEEVAVHFHAQVHSGGPEASDDPVELAGLAAEWERFCQDRADTSTLSAEAASNTVNWSTVDLQRLSHDDEMVAREARLCVELDGRPLAEVARDAGAGFEQASLILGDADPTLQARLVAARDGELIGPLRLGDHHEVVLVLRRVPPSLDDPAVRARARGAVIERALSGEVSRHIHWHWHGSL